jgi:hypothetical protein
MEHSTWLERRASTWQKLFELFILPQIVQILNVSIGISDRYFRSVFPIGISDRYFRSVFPIGISDRYFRMILKFQPEPEAASRRA